MNAEKIILYDSDEAASLKTVTGWVSGDGRFFGNNEHSARYAGCTHILCECGKPTIKYYLKCEDCRAVKHQEEFFKMPYREWDGSLPVFNPATDKYYFDVDNLEEDILEEMDEDNLPSEITVDLILCSPQHYYKIDQSYWEDILPGEDYGDADIPKELENALNSLNIVIDNLGPASWIPSKTRTSHTFKP